MNPGRREALLRVLAGAAAIVSATLVFLHFRGMDEAVARARLDVSKVHEAVARAVESEIDQAVKRLRAVDPDAPTPPEGFQAVGVYRATGPADGPPGLLRHPRLNYWVRTFTDDTDIPQEGQVELGGAADRHSAELRLQSGGEGEIRIEAEFADAAAPASLEAEVSVALQIGEQPPQALDPAKAVRVVAGIPTSVLFPRIFDETIRAVPHRLVLTVPPGTPPLVVRWTARVGRQGRQEVMIAVRSPKADDRFLVGTVALATVTHRLARGLVGLEESFRSDEMGDRIYLTDLSGTVAAAWPDFDPRVKRRIRDEGRGALNSIATQKVKVGARPDTDSYEGFLKAENARRARVVGAWGTLGSINGGLIVEREEHRVLEPWRGLQIWHLTTIVFALLLVWPLVPPLLRRIREDTELPRLSGYVRPYLPVLSLVLISMVLYATGRSIQYYYTKVITEEVLLSVDGSAFDTLKVLCLQLVGVSAGMFAAAWTREYFSKTVEIQVVNDLRVAVCEKIVHLPLRFHSRQRAGDLLSRINNDTMETKRSLEMLFGDVLQQPFLLVGGVITAFVLNWRLALVVFIGLPILAVPISYFGRSIKKYARKRQARKADVTQAINEMLAGIRVVKAFRMEQYEATRIRSVTTAFVTESIRVARNQVSSKELLELVQNLSGIMILLLGGWLVLEKSVTLADLMAFIPLLGGVYRSSKDLTSTYNKMQESLAGTERIFEILDTPDAMADRTGARALVRPRDAVAFEGVWFRYHDEAPWVLQDVSFRAAVGSTVALVGATGSGKSTLLDLVARFHDPAAGRVTIDGVDLRDFGRTSLMAQIAVVTQEPFLFNASIAENIRYGRPGATQAEIEAAARAAFIHEEILRQPEGYETVVGERGGRLSGGQRQRITIARALLKDPPILILDEATSSLDSRAERVVQDALNALMRDRTTFVIAHRLSTIRHADLILVVKESRIVESGTHDELMRRADGEYRHLHDMQFGRDRAARAGEPISGPAAPDAAEDAPESGEDEDLGRAAAG